MSRPHKTKQYLTVLIKVLILTITFGYIYSRFINSEKLGLEEFTQSFMTKGFISIFLFCSFICMSMCNWFLEALKWKVLCQNIAAVDFNTAVKQTLASLTVSLATPNRIGEYGAKALFFEPGYRKKILLLNLFSNLAQMSATLIFGTFGLLYFYVHFYDSTITQAVSITVASSIAIAVGAIIFRKKEWFWKGFSLQNMLLFFKRLSRKKMVFLLSIARYAIFSMMFYALMLFFGASLDFKIALPLIFAMYLIVSVIPSFFILDIIVKGGVAVWLFSFVDVPDIAVLATVFSMWLFNFVIPSLIGSLFIVTYQPAVK